MAEGPLVIFFVSIYTLLKLTLIFQGKRPWHIGGHCVATQKLDNRISSLGPGIYRKFANKILSLGLASKDHSYYLLRLSPKCLLESMTRTTL